MAFFGRRALRRFPDYETLPYEPISPPQDLLADRLLALHRLARGEPETLIVEAGALLEPAAAARVHRLALVVSRDRRPVRPDAR